MNDINEIYRMLNWQSSFGDQLQGIKLAKDLDDLTPLILTCATKECKGVWENCARALYEVSDERLEKYLPYLLEWLYDLNQAGAWIILDRLKVFSGKKLKGPFVECLNYLSNINSESGQMFLSNLSELLDNEELKAELPKPIIETLQKHYKNWGF